MAVWNKVIVVAIVALASGCVGVRSDEQFASIQEDVIPDGVRLASYLDTLPETRLDLDGKSYKDGLDLILPEKNSETVVKAISSLAHSRELISQIKKVSIAQHEINNVNIRISSLNHVTRSTANKKKIGTLDRDFLEIKDQLEKATRRLGEVDDALTNLVDMVKVDPVDLLTFAHSLYERSQPRPHFDRLHKLDRISEVDLVKEEERVLRDHVRAFLVALLDPQFKMDGHRQLTLQRNSDLEGASQLQDFLKKQSRLKAVSYRPNFWFPYSMGTQLNHSQLANRECASDSETIGYEGYIDKVALWHELGQKNVGNNEARDQFGASISVAIEIAKRKVRHTKEHRPVPPNPSLVSIDMRQE